MKLFHILIPDYKYKLGIQGVADIQLQYNLNHVSWSPIFSSAATQPVTAEESAFVYCALFYCVKRK